MAMTPPVQTKSLAKRSQMLHPYNQDNPQLKIIFFKSSPIRIRAPITCLITTSNKKLLLKRENDNICYINSTIALLKWLPDNTPVQLKIKQLQTNTVRALHTIGQHWWCVGLNDVTTHIGRKDQEAYSQHHNVVKLT